MEAKILFQDFNRTSSFALLVLATILLSYIAQEFLIPDTLYYEFYGEQLSIERIDKILELQHQWSWVIFLLLPLVYLIKFSVIGIWMMTCMIFQGYKTSYKKLLGVVIISEFVFVIPLLTRVLWFGLFHTDFSLGEYQSFYPLSLANLFDTQNMEIWWLYPLQSFNLFEVVYALVLSVGISVVFGIEFRTSVGFTVPAYFIGLLLWIIFLSFLTLNFS